MDKQEFSYYCACLGNMIANQPDWEKSPSSYIADFLRGVNVAYGYGKALADLAGEAYKLAKKEAEKARILNLKEPYDLQDMAMNLMFTVDRKDYKISAYYFAVCAICVALNMAKEDEVETDVFDEDELKKFDSSVSINRMGSPEEKKLEHYRIRLLDFSRNNPLVHFNTARANNLSLDAADLGKTIAAISGDKKIYLAEWRKFNPETILKCKLCGRYSFRKYVSYDKKNKLSEPCPDCDKDNSHNRKSMVTLKENLQYVSEKGVKCKCGEYTPLDAVKEGVYTCAKCGEKLEIESYPLIPEKARSLLKVDEVLCRSGDESSQEACKKLINKANGMQRNFGLHVTYVACGFLHWTDKSGTKYTSPILLCPVNLVADRAQSRCYFSADHSNEGKFEVNKTLLHMLSVYDERFSVPFPEYDPALGGNFFSYIKQVWQHSNHAVATATADWYITQDLGIGLFHYQKLQLEHDLVTNTSEYLAHPVIRRICGDTNCRINASGAGSDSLQYMILDADSSQEDVIRAAQQGKSFILQGPPGSGKSQTISNIIATAVGEGKTVLFVTEKASARSVISDNLNRLHIDGAHKLTDFVLDFDDFNKRAGVITKKSFAEKLNETLTPYKPAGGFSGKILADERYYKSRVKSFMDDMRKTDKNGLNYLMLAREVAPFITYPALTSFDCYGIRDEGVAELLGSVAKFYAYVDAGKVAFNYKDDPLICCLGDCSGKLLRTAVSYLDNLNGLNAAADAAEGVFGLRLPRDGAGFAEYVYLLDLWKRVPVITREIAANFTKPAIYALLEYAKTRAEQFKTFNLSKGKQYESEINKQTYAEANVSELKRKAAYFSGMFKRIGAKYKKFALEVSDCFVQPILKPRYKIVCEAVNKLSEYERYLSLKKEYNDKVSDDSLKLGVSPSSEEEWNEIIKKLSILLDTFKECEKTRFKLEKQNFALNFTYAGHSAAVDSYTRLSEKIRAHTESEKTLSSQLAPYFETESYAVKNIEYYTQLSKKAVEEKDRLADWYNFLRDLSWFKANGAQEILDELVERGVTDLKCAQGMVYRTYFDRLIDKFARDNNLNSAIGFEKGAHVTLMSQYAEADKRMLSTGAVRLYEKLAAEKQNAARIYAAKHNSAQAFPKFPEKFYSIKQIISDNKNYVQKIKPCFMMSPLNVSQYIDIGIKFDLVIFDEASQIFTEDALASIVRGNQIIIAGDSKQLPPCDFFRAGEVSLDYEEQFAEDEAEQENSILNVADAALGDLSIKLCWHYRSCDEALIAFSNEHFGYNLISFPSAVKDENDGIEYVNVPYALATCYVSGKSGAHVNIGEADKIVELLYREITHPVRSKFTLGVVAFSNAQALEIETRWLKFKEQPANKNVIEAWEKLHEDEPIIFCNLDTMQGDERDTMLISICYSKDKTGKFTLPYLGRLRLSSGKKRLNVAITRARHRMVVVSTMDKFTLENAVATSSAPDENKEGAVKLCEFLKYAEQLHSENDVATASTDDRLIKSVCTVLDEAGVAYDTEIGRSECKINVGVKAKPEDKSYVLGIILDNPDRNDFDSPREYSRLTEQVLTNKYKWSLYRVFPIAWVKDYDREKNQLLSTVFKALNAVSPEE